MAASRILQVFDRRVVKPTPAADAETGWTQLAAEALESARRLRESARALRERAARLSTEREMVRLLGEQIGDNKRGQ
jgi:hypothetical protein